MDKRNKKWLEMRHSYDDAMKAFGLEHGVCGSKAHKKDLPHMYELIRTEAVLPERYEEEDLESYETRALEYLRAKAAQSRLEIEYYYDETIIVYFMLETNKTISKPSNNASIIAPMILTIRISCPLNNLLVIKNTTEPIIPPAVLVIKSVISLAPSANIHCNISKHKLNNALKAIPKTTFFFPRKVK